MVATNVKTIGLKALPSIQGGWKVCGVWKKKETLRREALKPYSESKIRPARGARVTATVRATPPQNDASALPVRRSGCRPSALCHPRARKLPRANPLSTARGSHLHAAAAARQRAAAERTAVHRRRSARRHARREQRSNGESRECEVPAASALQLPPRGSTGVGGGRRRRRRAAGGASKVRWI